MSTSLFPPVKPRRSPLFNSLTQLQPNTNGASPGSTSLQPRVATAPAAAPAPGVSSLGAPGSSSGFGWLAPNSGAPYRSSVGTFPQQGQNTSAQDQALQDSYSSSAMDFANHGQNQIRANGPFIDFAQRQGMSDPRSSPFYKSLLTAGREGVSDAYSNAGAANRLRANVSGFGYEQPIAQGADRELSAAQAHDDAQVPGQALMQTPQLMNEMLQPGMAGAGIRADEAGTFAKLGEVPAQIGSDYGRQGLGYFDSASQNEQAKRSRQSQLYQSLMQMVGQMGSSAMGMYGRSSGGCWIAEAIYGVDDPRTLLLRQWLNLEYRNTNIGRVVMAVYLRFGQSIAKAVKRSALLKRILRPLFEAGLQRAWAWQTS